MENFSEITVIPADNPIDNDNKCEFLLNWVVKEYMGSEIYSFTKEMKQLLEEKQLTIQQVLDDREWPVLDDKSDYKYHKTIKNREDLKEGDEVIVKGNFYDYIWDIGIVCSNDNSLYIDLTCNIMYLCFSEDDRECWCTSCLVNKKCLEPLSKLRIGDQ